MPPGDPEVGGWRPGYCSSLLETFGKITGSHPLVLTLLTTRTFSSVSFLWIVWREVSDLE